jgi:hypothetical protein
MKTSDRRTRFVLLAAVLAIGSAIGPSSSYGAGTPTEEALADLWTRASAAGAIGMYRDDDGSVAVVMPESVADAFTTADASATGMRARVVHRPIDGKAIASIMSRLAKRDWSRAPDDAAFGAYFDAKLGRVMVQGDASPGDFDALVSEWSGQLEYRQVDNVSRLSRRNELAPIDGGAAAWDGAGAVPDCTTGFRVTVNGLIHMVTAGHCFSVGQPIRSQDSGVSMGTVVSKALFPAQDMLLLRGAAYSTRIYVGNQAGVLENISGVADPSLTFDNYCYSGWVSAERCGNNVTNLNGMYCDPGCTINLAVFVGPTVAQGGDSGAPFYIANANSTNGIRGMLVAKAGNTMFAHKWSTIRDWWGATFP